MIGPCPWPGCPNRTASTRGTRTRGTSTANLGRDTRARQSGADFLGSQILKICDDGSNDYIRPRMESSSTYRCPRLLRMITSPQSSRENLSLYFSCAVKRRWSTAGKDPPGNWFAPPGSNRSSSGGNEAAEASGVKGRFGDLASLCRP